MSQIIAKEFDAEQKIIRSDFKGSPNLFTTSDLNRQIEAIKYQLDQLDAKTCVQSDLNVTVQNMGMLMVSGTYTYMNVCGCSFRPIISGLTIELSDTVYLILTAKKKLITYDDDFSHEISGVKFQDGTSMPAANHYVYYEEQAVLSTTLSVDNFIAVLAVISKNSAGDYVVSSNCLTKETSLLRVSMQNYLKDYNPQTYTPIKNGDSYDEAISKIGAKLPLVGGVYPIIEKSLDDSNKTLCCTIPEDVRGIIQEGDIVELVSKVDLKSTSVDFRDTNTITSKAIVEIGRVTGESKSFVFRTAVDTYSTAYFHSILTYSNFSVWLEGDVVFFGVGNVNAKLIIYKKQ